MSQDTIKNAETVWANCLEIIKADISEQSFNTWFKPIKPLSLEGDVLTIEVPSPYFYEWLEEYYIGQLKKAIQKELGENGKLDYSILIDKAGDKSLNIRNNNAKKVVKKVEDEPQTSVKTEKTKHETSYTSPFELPPINPLYANSQLNPNYTFENYIEGDCNSLARNAGIAIAKKPGATSFNPFVVYGGVGLGKTHLLQAIGNEVKKTYPNKFVLYVTTDQFTQQFIDAVKDNSVQQFTNFYLKVDVLIMDDIQFLAKKEKTQEIFFHIFNRLHQSGKQIIMTSDCPPANLQDMQERLLSRFKWGLTADVQKPDFETRVAIIQTKMRSEGAYVPNDVVEYIARNIDSNIRELEGVLISLIANSSFMRKDINLDLAKATILNIVRHTEKEITIEFIQQIVADYFDISVEELKSKTRKKDIANARQIAMYFSQQYTKLPLKSIGDSFGGRDHSTVVHASKTVEKRSHSDTVYNRVLEELLELMQIKK
ncbi:MAG: chromosomal replication initiator protein DnaA [Bacteroidia bacterium]